MTNTIIPRIADLDNTTLLGDASDSLRVNSLCCLAS
jgi:hypothetical protein